MTKRFISSRHNRKGNMGLMYINEGQCPKNLLFVVNNGRVLLQQPLGVRSENAFFTLKLDQLLVHQLDVALGEIILQKDWVVKIKSTEYL